MQQQYIFTASRATTRTRDRNDMQLNCASCDSPLYVPAFEWIWVQQNEPVILCDGCRPINVAVAGVAVVPGAHEHLERTCGRAARRRMEQDLHRWNGLINARSN